MYTLVRSLHKMFKTSMVDYCDLETLDSTDESRSTLVTKNGSLVSVFEVLGSPVIVGREQFDQNLDKCLDELGASFAEVGFNIQFVFKRDKSNAPLDLQPSIDGMKETAKVLDLQELIPIIDDRNQTLSGKIAHEKCYVVVKTTPSKFTKEQFSTEVKKRVSAVSSFGIGIKQGEYSQSPYFSFSGLRSIHKGFVNQVESLLDQIVYVKKYNAHEAIIAMRKELFPDAVSPDWRPNLLGDKIPARFATDSGFSRDLSHLLNPAIGFQLFNQSPSIHDTDPTIVKMGTDFIAPMYVDIPPLEHKPFSDLFKKIPKEIPWRWTLNLESGSKSARSKIANKMSFATFLAFFSNDNKLIKAAAQDLLHMVDDGENLAVSQMTFCTWGKTLEEVKTNKQILSQAAQSWGGMEIIEDAGDPIESWCDTIPCMSNKHVATPYPTPLENAFSSLPLSRPSSPWASGSSLFRTMDDKLFAMDSCSSEQTSWLDIVFAPPGYGKSFFLASSNMSLILKKGNTSLPRIVIFDIGFSSKAFVNLIRSALPEDKKHYAQAYKLENTKDYCINIFDTPLGCQKPFEHDRSSILDFISLVLTPAEKESVPKLSEATGMLVDAMYESVSEKGGSPILYTSDKNNYIDSKLRHLDLKNASNQYTWYALSRLFFKEKMYHEAHLCHKYAMPTLTSATRVLTSNENIKQTFAESRTASGEPLISFMNTMINTACNEYPILVSNTVFDIGESKIMSMDLSSFATGDGIVAKKRLAIGYLISRKVMCADFYIGEDIIDKSDLLDEFKIYHKKKLDNSVIKKVCLDEYHETSKFQQIRDQVVRDVRVGRKYNVLVAVLSQLLDDFDEALISLATNIFILSAGSESEQVKIKEAFKPSPDAFSALKKFVHGPTSEGSSMLYIGKVKGNDKGSRNFEHVVRLIVGVKESWAYTTTYEDMKLREKMSARVGLAKTLNILSSKYPNGSAKADLHKRASERDSDAENIYDPVIDELLSSYDKKAA